MVVFYSIVLIIDMQLLNMLWYKMAPLMGRGPSTVSPNEDVDVAAERHRVNEMTGGTELDVVTLDGLTKVTRNAVISFAPDQFHKIMKLMCTSLSTDATEDRHCLLS